MNINNTRRALLALMREITTLEKKRRHAKNTIQWDKKNSTKLFVAKRMRKRLTYSLLEALEAQGQFSHDSLGRSRVKANQDE